MRASAECTVCMRSLGSGASSWQRQHIFKLGVGQACQSAVNGGNWNGQAREWQLELPTSALMLAVAMTAGAASRLASRDEQRVGWAGWARWRLRSKQAVVDLALGRTRGCSIARLPTSSAKRALQTAILARVFSSNVGLGGPLASVGLSADELMSERWSG